MRLCTINHEVVVMLDWLELSQWEVMGGVGMAFIEASYLTQIVRLSQRKEADDISLMFPGLNLLGRIMAMVSSIFLNSPVFVLGFMVGILLRLTFFLQVVWYRYQARLTTHAQEVFEIQPTWAKSAKSASVATGVEVVP